MAPCLSKFPSVCLEAIFKHVPLVDLLLSVGLVCTTWYKSRRTELLRRRRLVIVRDEDLKRLNRNFIHSSHGTDLIQHVRRDDGSPWLTLEPIEQLKFHALVVPRHKLTISFISSLEHLSNITHLTMTQITSFSLLPQVTRLIDNFSEHLVELKVQIGIYSDHDEAQDDDSLNVTNLLACLNRFRSLQHLRLDLINVQPHLALHIRPQLSILSRLTTCAIRINGFEIQDGILSSLQEHATNVRSIEVHNLVSVQDMLQVDQQLDTKFISLFLYDDGDDAEDYDDMRLFGTRFSSLTNLLLINCSIPMTMLARCLSPLRQLVHLDLMLDTIPQVEEVQSDEELSEEEDQEEQAQPEIAQIRSVRLLKLHFTTKSHLDTERFFISEVFPNLQVLQLSHHLSECQNCAFAHRAGSYYRIGDTQPELALRIAECIRLTRQPFRRCVNLHTVALDNETLINVDEL